MQNTRKRRCALSHSTHFQVKLDSHAVTHPLLMSCMYPSQIRVFPFEDVGMGMWVSHISQADKVPIQYENDDRFSLCCCENDMINGTRVL